MVHLAAMQSQWALLRVLKLHLVMAGGRVDTPPECRCMCDVIRWTILGNRVRRRERGTKSTADSTTDPLWHVHDGAGSVAYSVMEVDCRRSHRSGEPIVGFTRYGGGRLESACVKDVLDVLRDPDCVVLHVVHCCSATWLDVSREHCSQAELKAKALEVALAKKYRAAMLPSAGSADGAPLFPCDCVDPTATVVAAP
jgi:hypothetical protein